MTKKNILVTSALPYANGSLHLGHLVEAVQTDIWVRFQKMLGHNCYYMCADDTHGTAIMLSAQKQGITPEELIQRMGAEHYRDFQGFMIDFDHYYTTHSPENKELAEFIYNEAKKQGAIFEREIDQLYCPKCEMFLPDRFIKGACPVCGAADQYGDSCEQCSATYAVTALVQPFCVECQSPPVIRQSQHHFFRLSAFTEQVQSWLQSGAVQDEIKNKLQEWFDQGIKDWDISRDAPYFGFNIPGTVDKFFYVWLDAPVGYLATTKNWCALKQRDFDQIWRQEGFEVHHFIGKDILYFHTLFWPAMLMSAGFRLPTQIHVHGFLTVNGTKMSKSRGTFINAQTYLQGLNPEFLRYYFAAKLTSGITDLDLSFADLVTRVNADVVNKVVNIGSRLGAIINKKLTGKLTQLTPEGKILLQTMCAAAASIEQAYVSLEYSKAMREIMLLADVANKYIDEKAPWALVKENPETAAAVCTDGLNCLRILMIYLKPVLPAIAAGVEKFLAIPSLAWTDLETALLDHQIQPYEHLAQRLDLAEVAKTLGQ